MESPRIPLPQMELWLGSISASLPTLALALYTDEFIAGCSHAPVPAALWGHTAPFVPSPCSVDVLWQCVHAAPRTPQSPVCPACPASLWECSLSPPMGAAPTCVIGATPVQRALRWDRGVLVHPR